MGARGARGARAARAEPPVRSIGTDPAAFTEFYRAHSGEVTRFVTRRVADPQLAADLTADVFLAVIEAAAGYRGSFGGPRTWLFGIARNVIAAEFRRSARQRRAEDLIAGRRLLDADDVDRLVAKIDAFRDVRALHQELQALPEGERAVLELVAVDGLSVAEAAAALGIRPVAARVRLHRARQALRSATFQLVVETEVIS
jgi:RNA polymerase sigma factor (sigma-70 family)